MTEQYYFGEEGRRILIQCDNCGLSKYLELEEMGECCEKYYCNNCKEFTTIFYDNCSSNNNCKED